MNPNMKVFLNFLNMLTLLMIVVGALNWLFIGIASFNIVEWLAQSVGTPSLANIIYIIVGLSAIVHIISIDYYLPFLGQTAYPCGSLLVKTPDGADKSITVKVEPNANVVYWAAEKNSGDLVKNPWLAYSEFANTGVAKADKQGNATLSVRKPATYRVPPFGSKVLPHIHYRTCDGKGMLGDVKKVMLSH